MRSPNPQGGAGWRRWPTVLVSALAGSAALSGPAGALDIDTGSDVQVHLVDTLKYSGAARVADQSPILLANVNGDDGERSFPPGLISDRFDLLSELTVNCGDTGARVSWAAWYDISYNERNSNDSQATFNGLGPSDKFPSGTRAIQGRDIDLLDAYVFDKEDVGDMPLTFRIGRHALLWGESLLIPTNGIAAGQAPLDVIKALSVPNTLAKELFLPVAQVSGQLQVSDQWSISAYAQLQWRKTRLPAADSYFADIDAADAGGRRLIAGPGIYFYRGKDERPNDFGQGGLSLHYQPDWVDAEFGLYFLNYDAKEPQVYLRPGLRLGAGGPVLTDPSVVNLGRGQIGLYGLTYPSDSQMYGASFSTDLEEANVGGEFSIRENTPLVSVPAAVAPGQIVDADHPPGAIGSSANAQLSVIYFLPHAEPFWQGGSFSGEIAWNHRLGVDRNRQALDPTTTTDAVGLRWVFEPAYYQVLPGLDVTIPLGLGFNPKGASSVVQKFNGGYSDGGDVSIGVTATFREAWRARIGYTRYFGSQYTGTGSFNSYFDRDFISWSVSRTI